MKYLISFIVITTSSLSFAGKGGSYNDFYVSRLACGIAQTLADGTEAYRCSDRTITMSIEPSDAKFTYEGLCGPIAASNVMYPYCSGKVFSPNEAHDKGYFSDITPGTRPRTLVSGLNRIFRENSTCPRRGSWKYYKSSNGYKFLNFALRTMNRVRSSYTKAPFIAMIKTVGSSTLHYVTVTDIFFAKSKSQTRQRRMRRLSPSEASASRRTPPRRSAQRETEARNATQYSSITRANQDLCRVKYNDGKFQKIYTCDNFLKIMRQANDGVGMGLILGEYNYLLFK